MVYFRTYIFTFNTPNVVRYYVGYHKSKHKDPSVDNYSGSGVYPKRAVSKYGRCCIVKKVWFEHDTEPLMKLHEPILIKELFSNYGNLCRNIAMGGEGGDTIKYTSPERRLAILKRRSDSLK